MDFEKVSRDASHSQLLELLVSVCVIGVAAAAIIGQFSLNLNAARAAAASAEVLSFYRADMMTFRAVNGRWPADGAELRAFIPEEQSLDRMQSKSHYDVQIEGGALHVSLLDTLEGKRLTLHPVVPEADALGPVSWVAGPAQPTRGRVAVGPDATTLEQRYIRPDALTR